MINKRYIRYWRVYKDIPNTLYSQEILKAFSKSNYFKKISDKRRLKRLTRKVFNHSKNGSMKFKI